MDETSLHQNWRTTVEFVGLDPNDDAQDEAVVDSLMDMVDDVLRFSTSESVTTIEAVVAAETEADAVVAVIAAVLKAVPSSKVLRLVDPLVNLTDIADVAGVTRQAARNWALGLRQSGFPRPLAVVGDGIRVWRLAEVDRWLTEAMNLGSAHHFPSAAFIADFNEDQQPESEEGDWFVASTVTEVQSDYVDAPASRPNPTPARTAATR